MKHSRLAKGIAKGIIVFLVLMMSLFALIGCSSNKQEGAGQNAASEVTTSNEAKNETANETSKKTEDLIITTTTLAPKPTTTTTVKKVVNQVRKPGKSYVEIKTNKGNIVFELYPDKAPKTVASFIKLAKSGFFNGIKWHRVEPGFVIQGGDPLSKDNDPANDGTGGPGFTLKAEFNDMPHLTGTVAMARMGQDINSASSQFYICLAPQPSLDGQYTVFGQVVEGMDVVNSIAVGDVIEKVTITTK